MEVLLERMINELGNGKKENSILESLYELWINQDPAYDENVQVLYEKLRQWIDKMSIQEADRMTGIVADLCVAYSRKGFLDGARMGGLLVQEILIGNQAHRNCPVMNCPALKNICNSCENI